MTSNPTGVLGLVDDWPVDKVAAAIVVDGRVVASHGATDHVFRLASISKTITSWAALVAVEEGIIGLDTVVAPEVNDATLRHLLAHAGGYGFDGPDPIAPIERRRIYSNTGIEVAAAAVAAAAEMPFEEYLRLGVLEPLGMATTELRGSPAHAMWSGVADVATFMREVMSPSLVSEPMGAAAIRPHFASLGGIVPGVGRFDTCPWGLGFEVRGDKSPHWTGSLNSAATCGHFGGSGTFMWIDPDSVQGHHVGVVALTDRAFDEWSADALRLWPELSDAVIGELTQGAPAT
ncbi:MAG: serine hydrolase domain-containing protein [Ilumatobacter sp.]|uniref:serine hydrolase domain-containing protein n=1 Tax=Ilumatobacter sp. TaxID=1967498 RepID=UPI0032989EB9